MTAIACAAGTVVCYSTSTPSLPQTLQFIHTVQRVSMCSQTIFVVDTAPRVKVKGITITKLNELAKSRSINRLEETQSIYKS